MAISKTLLIFSSVFFAELCAIFGAFMLSASVYSLYAFDNSNTILVPCLVGAILGGLLFIATIVGCCGTITESKRAIWTYVGFLTFLLLAQIVVNFVLPVDFDKLATETINNIWTRQLSDDSMATFEIKYDCCGKNGPDDYINSGLTIPSSCYLNHKPSIANDLYTDGCIKKLSDVFSSSARIEIISDWSLVGIEAATIAVAILVGINFNNIERRQNY